MVESQSLDLDLNLRRAVLWRGAGAVEHRDSERLDCNDANEEPPRGGASRIAAEATMCALDARLDARDGRGRTSIAVNKRCTDGAQSIQVEIVLWQRAGRAEQPHVLQHLIDVDGPL